MRTNTVRTLTVTAVLIAGGAGALAATTTTVQPGPWLDPATWDNGVPAAATSDHAIVRHGPVALSGAGGDAASLVIGDTDAGELLLEPFSPLTVDGGVTLGTNGGEGRLCLEDTHVDATSFTFGLGAPARIDAFFSSIRTVNAGVSGDVIIGANGFPAIVDLRSSSVVSGRAITIGPDGLVMTRGGRLIADGGITLQSGGVIDCRNFISPGIQVPFEITAGGLSLEAGSVVDLSRLDFDPAAVSVGTRLKIFEYAGPLGASSPTLIPPLGYGGFLDFATPGVVDLEITSLPIVAEWTNPGVGGWFFPSNWASADSPALGERAFIRNGGTADTTSFVLGSPVEILLRSLVVGDETGDGTLLSSGRSFQVGANRDDLGIGSIDEASVFPAVGSVGPITGSVTITDADSLEVTGQLNVGELRAQGTAVVTGSAGLTIERVTDVIIGDDLDIGTHTIRRSGPMPPPIDGAVADGHATVVIRDVDTLSVGGDLDVCDGSISNNQSPVGRATAFFGADALFERINSFTIDSDLDLGDVSAPPGETYHVRCDVTCRDIGLLFIDADIDYINDGATGTGPLAGVLDHEATLTLERTTCVIAGDIDLNSSVDWNGDGSARVIGVMNLIDSSVTVDPGDTIDVGAINYDDDNPSMGSGDPGNRVEAYVNLTRSVMRTEADDIRVGQRLNNVPGALTAALDLREGSLLQAGANLELGTESIVRIAIDGTTTAQLGAKNVGQAGVHSVLRGASATIDGQLRLDFSPMPVQAGDMFVVLETSGAIAGDFSGFTFSGLPGGLVASYEIVDGPTDQVKVTVAPGCVGDVNGDGSTDVFDFADLAAGFGGGPSATRQEGDLNGDGSVDVFDFGDLSANFGCESP